MPAKRTPKRNKQAGAGDRSAQTVCLGQIVGAHGVRGMVRLKSYAAEPADIVAYGALSDETGQRHFEVTVTGRAKGVLLARIDGIDDRDAAEALRGTQLFVLRAALPPPTENDEYYYVDLIGLRAETADGATYGRISAIHDHGAGDIVEIQRPEGPSALVPFTREHVPTVDLEAGRVVVVPPGDDVVVPPGDDEAAPPDDDHVEPPAEADGKSR